MIIMPPHANIPYEWQIGGGNGKIAIVVPSLSLMDKTGYAVFMDKNTRELQCECKGFQIRGDCRHVRGLVWFCAGARTRKRGVQPTSIEAFSSIREGLGERQQLVLEALKILGHASNKQLSAAIGWPINCITPRIFELRERGLVDYHSEQIDPDTHRTEMVWRAV